MHRSLRVLVAGALGAVTAVAVAVVPAAPAQAFSTVSGVRLNAYEARFVALINAARRDRGIASLTVVPGFTDVARRWSAEQARTRTMKHNGNLGRHVAAAGGSGWRAVAENVGHGGGTDPDRLFTTFMSSAGHRANILNSRYRYLGIGWAELSTGAGFNTQVFVDTYSTAYGRSRMPAFGGLLDRRTFTSSGSLGSFETGPDPRLIANVTSSGLWSGNVGVEAPAAGDQGAKFSVKETASGTGGAAELRIRDAVDLTRARSVTIRIGASTGTGRALTVDLYANREWGDAVRIGRVTVPHRTYVTATFALPAGAKKFRNVVVVSVSRAALVALGSSGRSAVVNVKSLSVTV